MSSVVRKPDFCLCENKGAGQLCSNCTADLHLCFCYMDSTIPLLSKSKNFKLLTFCSCTSRFVSGLVRNPEDGFSHGLTRISLIKEAAVRAKKNIEC